MKIHASSPASILGLSTALLICSTALAQEPKTSRVSVDSLGAEASHGCDDVDISRCGRFVAFSSYSSNLVEGDTNNDWDIFVHDQLTGETKRASLSSSGVEGNHNSFNPSISGNGRWVAFESDADNLVENDTNGHRDIFLHDLKLGNTTLVSRDSVGGQANNGSRDPRISSENRKVTFESDASNLVAGDANGEWDIFVHDCDTGATTRVSVDSFGGESNDDSYDPTISADGRYVAFESEADNLVASDSNGETDVFLHDRETGETVRVGVDSSGLQPNDYTDDGVISGNGRFVAFESMADNLVAGDTNNRSDIFLHDRQTGETVRVSLASDGTEGNGTCYDPALSDDGRYVAFGSASDNLVDSDTNGVWDIFYRDLDTGVTTRVSVDSSGAEGNDEAEDLALSGNGRFMAFESDASNLVEGDTNGVQDVFARGYLSGEPSLVTVGKLDLFAGTDLDVVDSTVNGTMAAAKRVYLEHFASALRSDLSSHSDVITAGTKLVGRDGAVLHGNAAYGKQSALEDSVTFVDSSSGAYADDCLEFDLSLLHDAACDLSTSLGLTPATGTTLSEFGNLHLTGTEAGQNVFLVTRDELEGAASITLGVPAGATSIINVEGGKVIASVCGIQLQGAAAENVLFNFFEAHRVDLSFFNLEAGVLAPFAKLTVEDIAVYGNLIAGRLKLHNVNTFGQLFDLGSLVDPAADHFLGGEDGADAPGYTLTWSAENADQVVHLVYNTPELAEIWVDGVAVRQVRLDRLERLVFTGRADMDNIVIDPEVQLPVELTGVGPVAQDDHGVVGGRTKACTVDVLANDLEGPAATDASTVEVLTAPRYGTVSVDPATGQVTYTNLYKPAGVAGEVLWYTVRDSRGVGASPRRLRFSFGSDGSGGLNQD